MLAYNEFTYKKIYNHCKLEDRFQKKAIFQSHICKFADKKTAYNEGRLYSTNILCALFAFLNFTLNEMIEGRFYDFIEKKLRTLTFLY